MKCTNCGNDEECRFGICFDCASAGELRAARRTVLGHLRKAVTNIFAGNWRYMRFDVSWAMQRALSRGDYAKDGYFDAMGVDWR